jgi:hypothetical protein
MVALGKCYIDVDTCGKACIDSREGILECGVLLLSQIVFPGKRNLDTSKFDSENNDGNYKIQLAKNEK